MLFGGIFRQTQETFMVMCPGNKRTKKILHKLILQYIKPGIKILLISNNFLIWILQAAQYTQTAGAHIGALSSMVTL